MTFCMDCRKDVFGVEKERCKEIHYDALDFENLLGNVRIRILKPRKKSTLKFPKKIDFSTGVPYP